MIEQFSVILIQSLRSVLWALQDICLIALVLSILGLCVQPRRSWQTALKAAREMTINVQLLLFNTVFIIPVLSLVSLWITQYLQNDGWILVPVSTWQLLPSWMVIVIAVLVGDLIGYWRHRLEHLAVLWPAHAIHHSDREMTWTAIERFHPINRGVTFLVDGTLMALLGFPAEALFANYFVRHYYGAFIHMNLPWTYGWLGGVFVSPVMHRWHHSRDARAFDCNFATVFSFWDRWFGTYYVAGVCTTELGVEDPIKQSFVSQLLYPFYPSSYHRLAAWFKAQRAKPNAHGAPNSSLS